VKQIPLVAFDVGGIYEMLDYGSNADAIILNPDLGGLTAKLTGVLGLPCSGKCALVSPVHVLYIARQETCNAISLKDMYYKQIRCLCCLA